VWSEATLTAGYAPTKHAEIRLEARTDKSNAADAFVAGGAPQSATAKLTDRQNSAALQAIVKF
jgi:hypothetical protein